MNFFLLDGSVLFKRYALDQGTDLIDHLFRQVTRDRLACLMLSVAEVLAALVRRRRSGRLTAVLFQGALLHLRTELLPGTDFVKWPADNDLVLASLPLVERHRLGAVDSVLLRIALHAAQTRRAAGHDLVLMTTRAGLRRAARQEGIATFNPETQSLPDLDHLLEP
jgi:predicted nucleic acid-binding protein